MSLVEIVTALYFHHLKIDPNNCDWTERDKVVLSKAMPPRLFTQYFRNRYVTRDNLDKYYAYKSPFQGHADRCYARNRLFRGSLGQDYPLLQEWDSRKSRDYH